MSPVLAVPGHATRAPAFGVASSPGKQPQLVMLQHSQCSLTARDGVVMTCMPAGRHRTGLSSCEVSRHTNAETNFGFILSENDCVDL